jgi:hypothetical protein
VGFLDKAKDFVEKHDKQVDQALEKAGDFVDQRTGGKHSEQIDKVVQQAQQRTGDGDQTADRAAGEARDETPRDQAQ